MMPDIPHLERDQRCRRKYHQQFRPSLLHVNAYSFRKKNRRVKERQKTSAPQHAACEHGLQFVEQVVDGLAVLHQNFVSAPVRHGIHPAGTCIQEEKRNTEQKQEDAFTDLEERNELKIAMTTRLLQNRRNVRWLTHCPTVR